MNWDAIGALSELLGAAGVIFTLVYLASQIRENNKLMKAEAKRDQASQTKDLSLFMFDRPEFFTKLLSGESLGKEEKLQASVYCRALFRLWESYKYSHEVGQFDDLEWVAFSTTMKKFVNVKAIREAYGEMRDELSPRLQQVVDGLIDD
jgi:hypothetical protein